VSLSEQGGLVSELDENDPKKTLCPTNNDNDDGGASMDIDEEPIPVPVQDLRQEEK